MIYIWKIIEGCVPNCGVDLANENPRLGRRIKIPSLKKNGRKAVQTLREQSFQINGGTFVKIKKSSRLPWTTS